MLGTSVVDRRETRLAGDAIGRKLFVGRHRTCKAKVERQDAEFFSRMFHPRQQKRNVRPVRLDASGAPGARAPTFAKSLYPTDVPTHHSPRRNDPSHRVPNTSALPTSSQMHLSLLPWY